MTGSVASSSSSPDHVSRLAAKPTTAQCHGAAEAAEQDPGGGEGGCREEGGGEAGVGVAPEPDPDHGAGGGLPRPAGFVLLAHWTQSGEVGLE